MRPSAWLLATACIVVACLTTAALARDIHVDAAAAATDADGSAGAPFATVAEGLKAAGPGDMVILRAGVYRESVRVPGGDAGRPVTVKAAPGERVVLSGARTVAGWQRRPDGLATAVLDFRPARLLLDGRPLPLARSPEDGWWRAEKAEGTTLADPAHLKTLPFDPAGAQAYIWCQHGNTFFTVPVESLDRGAGRLTVTRTSKWMTLKDGDRYILRNHPALIDRPGEWCVAAEGDRFRVTLKPADAADLDRIEAPKETRQVVLVSGPGHVRLEGFQVTGSADEGIYVNRCEDVVVAGCTVHGNGGTGIGVRDVRNITVRRCLAIENYCGVTLHTVRGAVVEENEIGRNGMDGLIVSWNTDDVTVRRNYIHHHLLWGHPDNVQMYRGVTNVRLVDNLLLAGGQAIMTEETSGGLIQGNTIVGSGAVAVILGHGNAKDYRIAGNTVAFCGYGCLSLTADGYEVRENVLVTGTPGTLFGVRGLKAYRGDRNLLFNAAGLERVSVVASDAGWHRDFAAYRKASGYDADSVYGDPGFRSAPKAYAVVDGRRLTECNRARLYLRKGGGPVAVGDTVELDFDGVPRKVAAIDGAAVTVNPPLAARPTKGCLVANWGTRTDLHLDLRLAPGSPGATLSAKGGPVGSQIDIAAYQRGDFDGDGKRDLPPWPPKP